MALDVPVLDTNEIQLLYKNDLINLSHLCQPEFQKELSEFFLPFSLKVPGLSIQKTADKYFT